MTKRNLFWLPLAVSAMVAYANNVPSHDTNPPPFLPETLAAVSQVKTNMNTFPIWSNGAPGALGNEAAAIPTLTVFLPSNSAPIRAAMIVCPGGAYGHLAKHEGDLYARWLNDQGIAAFVLKYRLGTNGYHHPAMLQDAARALRTVRARAGEWSVDPARIGMMGSSAGGHLTATLSTRFDAGDTNAAEAIERVSSRPDLAILCYPVITMTEPYTHQRSKSNLLGTNPPPELVAELSAELHVSSNTPPCFVWHAFEDKTVPLENTLMFAAALRRANVPFEYHVYEHGKHRVGLGSHSYEPEKWLPWTKECTLFLQSHGFLN